MPFNSILVALDGSDYSHTAADYAMWLASSIKSDLQAMHVVDPRMVDLFISAEFAEELGFMQGVETSEKVFRALKRIGVEILDLFSKRAFNRGLTADTYLDVGYVVDEIVKRGDKSDLVVIGHCGRGRSVTPGTLALGSVAERVAVESSKPVLIALNPVADLEHIVVAYDGSEPARGALIAAEALSLAVGKPLKAITIAVSESHLDEAHITVEQGRGYLKRGAAETFVVRVGHPARTIIDYCAASRGLLVAGAYGFRSPEDTVMGTTTSYLIRESTVSLIVFR